MERTLAGLAAARERGRVGGRPAVLTPENRAKARELMLGGMTAGQAARAMGIGKSTLYRAEKEIMEDKGDE